MALQQASVFQVPFCALKGSRTISTLLAGLKTPSENTERWLSLSSSILHVPRQGRDIRSIVIGASETSHNHKFLGGKREQGDDSSDSEYEEQDEEAKDNDPYLMDPEERREWRRKIREVVDKYPDVEEEIDLDEKRKKMQKLLADYPLVVDEDDPDWPDDADGWGFNWGQFFNKITIKNVMKEDDDNYDSENEIVWQDDNYIRPIKDITTAEWEEAVFKDISPLIVLVHNRYKRPKENEKIRDELEKAVHIIWNCRLPSPRVRGIMPSPSSIILENSFRLLITVLLKKCVAVDAIKEPELVSALQVSNFPEIIFTKAGKILYREKAIRTADEFSKIMAFFYYGAAKPPCLNSSDDSEETIPSVRI